MVSVLIALGCAWITGYGTGRYQRHKRRQQCESLCEFKSSGHRYTYRCKFDAWHTGPHQSKESRSWWTDADALNPPEF